MRSPDERAPSLDALPDAVERPLSNRSYLFKMAAGGVALLLVVVLIGGIIVAQTSTVLAQETRAEYERTSELQAEQTETWIQSMDRQATLLQQSFVVQAAAPEDIEDYFEQQLARLPGEIVAIHYVDFSGDSPTVVASTVDGYRGQTAMQLTTPWAQATPPKAGQGSTMTDIYDSDASSSPVVAFIAPTNTSSAVVMVVDLGRASEKLTAPENGRSLVVDGDGTIVLSTNPDDIGNSAFSQDYLTSTALDRAGAGQYYTTDIVVGNTPQVTGLTHTGERDLVAVSQAPKRTAFTLRNEVRNLLLVLVVGVAFVGALVVGSLGFTTVRDLRELSSRAERVSTGEFEVSLATDRGDEVGQAYASVDRMRNSLQTRIEEAREAAEEAEQARRQQRHLTRRLTEHVASFSEQMARAAGGDLTVRLSEDTDIKQLDDLASAFNDMLDALERSVAEAKRFSSQVATASRQTDSAVEDIRAASDDIASAMQRINQGATQQNEQLDDSVEELNALAATAEEIAATLNDVAALARETAETGRLGIEEAEEAVDEMQRVDAESEQAVQEIEQLTDRMARVEEILEFITDIADQLNMLALNANIEAARAGSEGDREEGFGVVAEQVKQLSEQSKEAAEEIRDLIEGIQDQTTEAADEVRRTRTVITEATGAVQNTVDALEQIATYAERTNEGIQDMDEATQSQAASAEEVVTMVEQVAAISETTAGEAEGVAAAAEEQTASIEQINASVSDLSARAARLDSLLEAFGVTDDTAEPGLPGTSPERELPDASTDRPTED